MYDEDIEELQFHLEYYKDRCAELSKQNIDQLNDIKRLEQEHLDKDIQHTERLKQEHLDKDIQHTERLDQVHLNQLERDDQHSKMLAAERAKYVGVRTAITELFDQLDWADIHGPGYKIAPRHPDLMHIILPKIESVRRYHWRFGEEDGE